MARRRRQEIRGRETNASDRSYNELRTFADTRNETLPLDRIVGRFVYPLRCPKGRFVYGTREGGAA